MGPPYIPQLDEGTYDEDVLDALERLHEKTSDELFDTTSKTHQPPPTITTSTKSTRGATYPEQRDSQSQQHLHPQQHHQSLPPRLLEPNPFPFVAQSPPTFLDRTNSQPAWPTDSPAPFPTPGPAESPPRSKPKSQSHSPISPVSPPAAAAAPTAAPTQQITTIYSTGGRYNHPHQFDAVPYSSLAVPTPAPSEPRRASLGPISQLRRSSFLSHQQHPPYAHPHRAVIEHHNIPLHHPLAQSIIPEVEVEREDPTAAVLDSENSNNTADHGRTSDAVNNMATSSRLSPSKERDERDRLDEPQPTTSPPVGRSNSGQSGTGIVSGGVSMGPPNTSPSAYVSPNHPRRPPQHPFTRASGGGAGQPSHPSSSYQPQAPPPMMHLSSQQQQVSQQGGPPSSYYPPHSTQEYTRATPSPVYYSMQYTSPHQMQMNPYGGTPGYSPQQQMTHSHPLGHGHGHGHMVPGPPPGSFAAFSQAAYGHPSTFSLSPELIVGAGHGHGHMGYGHAVYGQPGAYVGGDGGYGAPSGGGSGSGGSGGGMMGEGLGGGGGGSGSGGGHGSNTATAGNLSSSQQTSFGSSGSSGQTGAGGAVPPSSTSNPYTGPSVVVPPPPVMHPFHPQGSPIAQMHSPHMTAYPQFTQAGVNASIPTYSYPSTPYGPYGSHSHPHSTSPVQPRGYGGPFSGPTSPTVSGNPPSGMDIFSSRQSGGTWLYLPPGGGMPQQFQGASFGMGYPSPHQETSMQQQQQQQQHPSHQQQQPQQQQHQQQRRSPGSYVAGSSSAGTVAAPVGQPGGGPVQSPSRPGALPGIVTQPSSVPSMRGLGGAGGGGSSWRRGMAGRRGRGIYRGPRGGGPMGAGLAAGSPSGGSNSHPNTSESNGTSASNNANANANAVAGPSNPKPVPPLLQQHQPPRTGFMRRGTSPVRQAFHPKPPTHGNEWVMWVGNVPENALDSELWQFFQNPQAVQAMKAMLDLYASGLQPGPSSATTQHPPPVVQDGDGGGSDSATSKNGVTSIFLIKTSYCAFVNFDSEESLKRAVRTFNGVPLRPYDPECPRLVCRRRRKDDDLRSGVAAQRGWGLHTNWIRMQAAAMKKAGFVPNQGEGPSSSSRSKEKEKKREVDEADGGGSDDLIRGVREVNLADGIGDLDQEPESPVIMIPPHLRAHDDPPTSPSAYLGQSSNSDPSPPSKGDSKRPPPMPYPASSISSGSFASTNSSFLAKYFPKRYFILKSLTEYDLKLSVERGLWATQPHNEPILDQAFRTSKEVYLIFGANRTGEFFGYARMAAAILQQGDRKVPWAARSTDSSGSSHSNTSPNVPRQRSSYTVIVEDPAGEARQPSPPDSPQPQSSVPAHLLDGVDLAASPSPLVDGEGSNLPSPAVHAANENQSAPAELGRPHKRVTYSAKAPAGGSTLGPRLADAAKPLPRGPHLDPTAPFRAMKNPPIPEDDRPVTEEELARREENEGSSLPIPVRPAGEGEEGANAGPSSSAPNERTPGGTWGTAFKVQWIKTDHLPFIRLRHLRNRWNYDREVKVSRDGTELEPSTGDSLLREWDRLEEERKRLAAERSIFEQSLTSGHGRHGAEDPPRATLQSREEGPAP